MNVKRPIQDTNRLSEVDDPSCIPDDEKVRRKKDGGITHYFQPSRPLLVYASASQYDGHTNVISA